MTQAAYPQRAANPEMVTTVFRLQGTGAAALTLIEPSSTSGVAVGRTSAGIHTLTWTDDPGNYIGMTWGLEDVTPANVHDHQATADNYASKVLTFTTTDQAAGTPALDDLEATEFLILTVHFKRTSL